MESPRAMKNSVVVPIKHNPPLSAAGSRRDKKDSWTGLLKPSMSLVLSGRELEEKIAIKEHEEKVRAVKVGTITKGTVESIMPYGCFVNIGDGVSGLVHISQIAHKRLKTPSEVVKPGQEVDVKVIDIKDGKISLSMKALVDVMEKNETDEEEGPSEYLSGEEASTGMASLLAGIKID